MNNFHRVDEILLTRILITCKFGNKLFAKFGKEFLVIKLSFLKPKRHLILYF